MRPTAEMVCWGQAILTRVQGGYEGGFTLAGFPWHVTLQRVGDDVEIKVWCEPSVRSVTPDPQLEQLADRIAGRMRAG